MLSVPVLVDADLAVLHALPVKAVRRFVQIAAQCTHDAAVTGDEDIFVFLGFQLRQK